MLLTDGQMTALKAAACSNGTNKTELGRSTLWRNIDQLERRGLVKRDGDGTRYGFGRYYATDAGKAALSAQETEEG